MSRLPVAAGAVLAALGFLAGLASLAVPWATYRVTADVPGAGDSLDERGGVAVFQVDRGWWYVAVLLALLGLLALAATAGGRAARVAGPVAVVLGCLAVLLATTVGDGVAGGASPDLAGFGAVDVRTSRGAGAWYGALAGALLGLGTALVASGARRQ